LMEKAKTINGENRLADSVKWFKPDMKYK